MPFKLRFYALLTSEVLRGERLVLALLSIAWGAYLVGPHAPTNFLNIAGGMMFILFGIGVVFDLMTSDTLKVLEGFYGCCLWVIGMAYQYRYELDDTLYLMSIPTLLSWWIFANALARLKQED